MKLRAVTGNRYPVKCACAANCGAEIPAGADVKVIIDLDTSRPRLSYLPDHSPDAPARPWWPSEVTSSRGTGAFLEPDAGSYEPRSEWATAGAKPLPGFAPANQLGQAEPKPPITPAPPKAPGSSPLALLGSVGASDPTPSPNSGVAWATSSLTFNAGAYESARAGFADYCQPGETPEQLRSRVNRVVLEDLERSVRAMRELHERLGDTAPRTPSPARAAGAPSPCSPPSAMATTPAVSASSQGGGRGPRPACPHGPGVGAGDPAVADLVARISLELGDTSVRRKRAKESAVRKLCELRGLASLRQATSADQAALQALIAMMESINDWDLHAAPGVPAPQLDERLVLPA